MRWKSAFLFVLFCAPVFTARLWALRPIDNPSADVIKRLEKKRATALRALNTKIRLIRKYEEAGRKKDKDRALILFREIGEFEGRYHPARELAEVLTATREAYQIEPTPNRGVIDGKLREWKIEFDEIVVLTEVVTFGGGRAAKTSADDGTTLFFRASFRNIPVLASYLVHEAVHFEQLVALASTPSATSPQEELEAYATQLRLAPDLGVSTSEVRGIRELAESFYAAVVSQAHADISMQLAATRLEPALSIRYGKEIVAIAKPWDALAAEGFDSLRSPYWERRLRNERLWRDLRLTVSRLCRDGGASKSPTIIFPDYSVERSFAAWQYSSDLTYPPGLTACEQYVLEDYLIGTGAAQYRDLEKLVRHYRQRNGPWLNRIRAYGAGAYAGLGELGHRFAPR